MCGIGGYWNGDFPNVRPESLRHVLEALAHRGPDGSGVWSGKDVGLAHTRLAVIDLAGGQQPMHCHNGRYVISFNGEIYNHRELRAVLEKAGYAFKTRSDTEIIPAAVDHWGIEDALTRFRGMFAFALYDGVRDELLLARDLFGIKPLYFMERSGSLLFASEMKALLQLAPDRRRADPGGLAEFFRLGYTVAPLTCWADVKEMEPGTWFRLGRSGRSSGKFGASGITLSPSEVGLEEAVEKFRHAMVDSLGHHLESDVPLAAFLSGGIDSSILVTLICKALGRPIQSHTAQFEDADYDETPAARKVAAAAGSEHSVMLMGSSRFTADFVSQVLNQYDQPFGDSSCLPTWAICREMKKRVKVAIAGDGGDELFAGYNRYLTARRLAALSGSRLLRSGVLLASKALRWVHSDVSRMLHKAHRLSTYSRSEMLIKLHDYFQEEEVRSLFVPELEGWLSGVASTDSRFAQFVPEQPEDVVSQLQLLELRTVLHGDYLRKVDIASSAHGLEVRTPYLDTGVWAFARTLPASLKLDGGVSKPLMRAFASRILPPGLSTLPKWGFGIPLDRWGGDEFKGFVKDVLFDPRASWREWIREEPVMGTVRPFLGLCDRPSELSRYQCYQRAFMLLSFELWLRRWRPGWN